MIKNEKTSVKDLVRDFAMLWHDAYGESNDKLIVQNQELMSYLINDGFFLAPASTKYHGAYPGGLYAHSKNVYLRLKDLTEKNNLQWQRKESPFIIGMFHDLCKCDQYKWVWEHEALTPAEFADPDRKHAGHYEYNTNTILKGHGSKSVMILSRFINLTEEEVLCIRYHMGPYEKEEWNEFDLAIKKTKGLCFFTHAADMLASKLDED